MERGEVHFTGGCVEGASSTQGRCWLCGMEYEEESCCGTTAWCACMALATEWREVSWKNVALLLAHWAALPYGYLFGRWYS